jgi:hypothetical protein
MGANDRPPVRLDIDTGNAVETTGRDRCPPSPPHGSFDACEEVGVGATAPIKRISLRAIRTLLQQKKVRGYHYKRS